MLQGSTNRLSMATTAKDVQRIVSSLLGPHDLRVESNDLPHGELYDLALHRAHLMELSYGKRTIIDTSELSSRYLFRITLSGVCHLESEGDVISAPVGCVTVWNPGTHATIRTGDQYRSLLLWVERSAIEEKLASMLQTSLRTPLVFASLVGQERDCARAISSIFTHLCALPGLLMPTTRASALGADLTEWLACVLLDQLPHTYSSALASPKQAALPGHVRKACDYIGANLAEPLHIVGLARIAGVSERTLYNGFMQFLNTTPARYIRERRLEAVRQALSDPAKRVGDVLLDHGVSNAGNFARLYARRFGHLPSETPRFND